MSFNTNDSDRFKLFTRRAAIMGGAQATLMFGLAARMYYLQVIEADEYAMLAEENRVNLRLEPPLRGVLFDRFGVEIAANRQNFQVVLIPEQTNSVEETLNKLEKLVDISERERRRILREVRRSRPFVPVTVADNLDWEYFAKINVRAPQLPGVLARSGKTRHYPFADDLAHVVGYVGPVSQSELTNDPVLQHPDFRIGKSGIEKTLDIDLRGVAGNSRVEVNAHGRVIRELKKDLGKPGAEVVLTLDMEIQRYAVERLEDESATVIVMDCQQGDILALVSNPAFDPNVFNVGIGDEAWKQLVDDPKKPLVNKAIAGQYPPGSTFKMIVALAALEGRVMDPDEPVVCTGRYRLGTHLFHCWRRQGHGPMNMRDGIKNSCDIYFYELARRVGVERIGEMARRFGLGEAFDLGLPGTKAGLVPSRGWKQATTGVRWQQGETLITGIGQGYLLATPLQLAVMVARIGNGGKAVVPKLVHSVGGEVTAAAGASDMGLKVSSTAFVGDAMAAVTNEAGGTAYRSGIRTKGMELAGKTGTAQVRRITRAERQRGVIKNEDLAWARRDHALFVAFAPIHAPRYAISVVVEHGGSGSRAAGPVARDIMKKTLERDPASRAPYVPTEQLKNAELDALKRKG